jgi:large-conductance mechanosensitive channel
VGTDFLQLVFAILLLALGIMVAVQGVTKLAEKEKPENSKEGIAA